MAKIIQIRRDTSTNWQTINPTLAQGEFGYEVDTGKLKIGDGTTPWNDLPYFSGGGGIANPAGNVGEVQFNLDGSQLGADPNLYWDNTNKRLGIGTNSPQTALHVKGDAYVEENNLYVLHPTSDVYISVGKSNNTGERALVYYANTDDAAYFGKDGYYGLMVKGNTTYIGRPSPTGTYDGDAPVSVVVDMAYEVMKFFSDRTVGIMEYSSTDFTDPASGYGKILHDPNDHELYWARSDGTRTRMTIDKFLDLTDVSGEREDFSLIQMKLDLSGVEFTKVIFPHACVSTNQRVDNIPYKTGLIVPYYEYPWDNENSTWKTSFIDMITFFKNFHNVPILVVVNPNNGPGSTVDTVWRRAIKMLRGAGAMVLGYVDTNYTNVSEEDAKQTIDDWKSMYEIDGIFLDRMTSDDNEDHRGYYFRLTMYAHSRGFCPVVGNAGALVPSSYILSWCADIIVVHENNTYPNESDLAGGDWEDSYREIPYWRKAAIVWGQATLDKERFRMMQKYCGFVYVTSSSDYTSQPDYLQKELFYCALYDNPHPEIDDGFDFGSHVAYFALQTYTTTSSSVTIDWNKGNKAKITLTQDATLSFVDPPGACNLVLLIEQDSNGGHNITFPSSVKWADGLEMTPTQTANAVDIVTLFFDGTNYYANASYNYS